MRGTCLQTDKLDELAKSRQAAPKLLQRAGVAQELLDQWFSPQEASALHAVLIGHTDDVTACCTTPDSRLVITASRDNTAICWRLRTGVRAALLNGHSDNILALCVSDDSRRDHCSTRTHAVRRSPTCPTL